MIHGADLADYILTMAAAEDCPALTEVDDGKQGGYSITDVAMALTPQSGKPAKIIALPRSLLVLIGGINN